MYLVEIFLPLYDNDGGPIDKASFAITRDEFSSKFGGVTVHSRAPVKGVWKEAEDHKICHDDLIIFEVMSDDLNRNWWHGHKRTLETRFRQEAVLIRAQVVERL